VLINSELDITRAVIVKADDTEKAARPAAAPAKPAAPAPPAAAAPAPAAPAPAAPKPTPTPQY
jgi:2-oxoglutarate dehydrogenase E2 component (dihydrolipoamide succinyltransferase)